LRLSSSAQIDLLDGDACADVALEAPGTVDFVLEAYHESDSSADFSYEMQVTAFRIDAAPAPRSAPSSTVDPSTADVRPE
jgi:hypothetical protein